MTAYERDEKEAKNIMFEKFPKYGKVHPVLIKGRKTEGRKRCADASYIMQGSLHLQRSNIPFPLIKSTMSQYNKGCSNREFYFPYN